AALVVDAERRPRSRAQPFLTDRLAATLAGSVAPVVESGQRAVDLRERLLRAFLEPFVELAVEGDRRHVAEVVVAPAPGELAELVLDVARVLLVQVRDRLDDALPLLVEQSAELGRVDRGHRRSFRSSPAAAARRRSISPEPIPASATILSLAACPETISMSFRGTSSVSASSRTTASLPLPAAGATSSIIPRAARSRARARRAWPCSRRRSPSAVRVTGRASLCASATISSASRFACSFTWIAACSAVTRVCVNACSRCRTCS